MKAELIINNTRLELGELSYVLDDCKKAKGIFHELAQSPSTETRSNIASQKNLHRKTVKLLLSDSQIEVMRTFITRGKFISQMGKEDIDRFINTGDSEVLTGLVENMVDLTVEYEICEKDWLCEKLYQQAGPSVRYELAENDETPEFILKKLLEDSDINVSQAAQDTREDIVYNEFKDKKYDSKKLEDEISKLIEDDDVSNKKGIYSYVLNRNEKHLNIRAFSPKQKREAYERQKGICPVCKEHFEIEEMEADHITPWHEGGKTSAENCQMLCKEDNRRKSGK